MLDFNHHILRPSLIMGVATGALASMVIYRLAEPAAAGFMFGTIFFLTTGASLAILSREEKR